MMRKSLLSVLLTMPLLNGCAHLEKPQELYKANLPHFDDVIVLSLPLNREFFKPGVYFLEEKVYRFERKKK